MIIHNFSQTAQLGVNEHHQAQVINYMRFARYQRGQRLRAVDMCFEDLKSSRLDETTYTIDEVTDMLDGLLAVVRGEVDDELINTSHTNILLCRQMFMQAEKWHLKLAADISELENRDLLEQIADFEEKEFAGTKMDSDLQGVLKNVKLTPINQKGGTELLHRRIEELDHEMKKLMAENKKAKEKLLKIGGASALSGLSSVSDDDSRSGMHELEVEAMRKQLQGMSAELAETRKSGAASLGNMETDLASTKHELLRIQEMLEMAEKELEKKVHQTTPFKNLKQMLTKKNDQIKDLRRRLSKYESLDD
ncbi:leucine zipper transcription factor-like protein 1 [Argopecten irradians]|uniref:leucine zipper transcription factor-like protein 1 n=1 Tax=Argopecten irradians TaxID=31199 RepID=UPI003724091E